MKMNGVDRAISKAQKAGRFLYREYNKMNLNGGKPFDRLTRNQMMFLEIFIVKESNKTEFDLLVEIRF